MSEQVITQAHLTIVDTNDIESIVMEYARNQSTSIPPDPNTGGWSTTRPDWAQNYYIWQRTRIHKTGTSSNEDTFGTAVCLTGSAGTNSYTHVRYAVDSSGTGMTATPSDSTTYIGIYNGTSSTAPTSASLYTWSKYVGENGNAVSRIQSIYYRTNTALSNSITGPTTWITVNTNQFNTTAPSTAVNGWSTKITPSAASADSSEKYLYLYTCTQTQSIGQAMNNGTTCVASTILLDETTTVIDGGNIITGTVHANAINASSGTFNTLNIPDLNASKITAGDIAADRITTNLISAINAEVSDISALEATIGGFEIDDTSIHTRQIGVTSNADNSVALSSTDFTRTINDISRSGLRFAMGDKFAVTGDGTVYASNVNLTGNITATSGTIGGCSINNGVLQVGNANVSNITIGKSQVTGLTGDLADAETTATDYITDIDSKAGITIHKAGDSALSSRYLKLNASGVYNYYDSNNRTEMLSTGFKIYKNNILRADYADAIKLYDSAGIQKLTLDTTNGIIVGEINKERIQINNTGTVIYDYDNDRTTNKSVKRTQIDKDGLHIYNTDGTTETGLFGAATARIGTTGGAAFHINDSSLQAYYVNGNTRTLYFQVSPTGMSYGPSLDNVVATTSDIPTTVAELTDSNDYLTTIIANNTYATQTSLTAETNRRKAVYGTAPATIAGSTVNEIATTMKTIVCDNFEEYIGARITIKFTNGNTAIAPTLKIVNTSGTQLLEAKAIWNANAVASATNPVLWGANATITFVYDGSVWIVENKPSSYSVSCDTSAATQIKRPVLNNIAQPVGAIILNGTTVTVNFTIANTYTNTNNHTAVQLNLSDTGAVDIYKNGIVTSYSNQLLWNANTELTFIRKGQYWYLVSRSDASETANAYITQDNTGIKIHDIDDNLNYIHIAPENIKIFKQTTNGGDSSLSLLAAEFGEEIVLYDDYENPGVTISTEEIIVGQTGSTSKNVCIDTNGVNIRQGTTNLAQFGSTVTIGEHSGIKGNIYIDGNNGIYLYRGNICLAHFGGTISLTRSNNEILIESSGISIIKNENVLAQFGSTVTIGKTGSTDRNVYIDTNGVNIRQGTTNLAQFGSTVTIGQTGSQNVVIDQYGMSIYDVENFGSDWPCAWFGGSGYGDGEYAVIGPHSNEAIEQGAYFASNCGGITIGVKNNSGYVKIYENNKAVAQFGSTVTIGQTTSTNKNVYIDTDGVNIRQGTTNLASFKANGINFKTGALGMILQPGAFGLSMEGEDSFAVLYNEATSSDPTSWKQELNFMEGFLYARTGGQDSSRNLHTGDGPILFYNNNNKCYYNSSGVITNTATRKTTAPDAVKCTNNTWEEVASLSLTAGIWVVTYGGAFVANATGHRDLHFGTTAPGAGRYSPTVVAVNGEQTRMNACNSISISTTTTYYLYARQNSGGYLNFYPYMQAVKI